jgi:hypothetical protein
MVQSAAKSVNDYLSELPEERRKVIETLRKLIRKNLPKGYVEQMYWGMICYGTPHNGELVGPVALAAQKNYFSLYLLGPYMDPAQVAVLKKGFAKEEKKLDMGQSCLRFKKLDDLALDAIAKIIAWAPPEKFIEMYEKARSQRAPRKK